MNKEDWEKHYLLKKELEHKLLNNVRNNHVVLEELLNQVNDHWIYEDKVYRFYHHSFKAYRLQESTKQIVNTLQSLLPEREMNTWFKQIVSEGTGKVFDLSHNQEWLQHTRPILEAFFHSKYFLEMAVKYSSLEAPPEVLPSGYAGLLYLFDLR
ncbi:hypothetical protein HZA97_03035 [Candidatus Woesearchaeota archaeon]|nr:hypothetical protein [Candidatus Woesearchaeota archaeon]